MNIKLILFTAIFLGYLLNVLCSDSITWHFDNTKDLKNVSNFENYTVENGNFVGKSKYDPFILLSLPGKVAASDDATLEARVYSSEADDNISVYYKSPNGDWCLGYTNLPIKKGWYIYNIPIDKIKWSLAESSGSGSNCWGGKDKLLSEFRLDPGNSAGRIIKIDWIKLSNGKKSESCVPDDIIVLNGKHKSSQISFDIDYLGLYSLSMDIKPENLEDDENLNIEISYFNILNKQIFTKTLRKITLKNEKMHLNDILDIPANAASIRVEINSSSKNEKAEIKILNLQFILSEKTKLNLKDDLIAVQYWIGEWIWEKNYDPENKNPVYFRRNFNIQSCKNIKSAKAIVTADNECIMYINGHKLPVGQFFNEWREVDIYDIKAFLIDGINTIAVKAVNLGGPAGLLAEAGISYNNGNNIFIKSDASWKCSNKYAEYWSKNDFDDSLWESAYSIGVPPVAPWGARVAYPVYLGLVNCYTVKKIDYANKITAGTQSPFNIIMSCDKITNPDTELTVTLESNNILLFSKKIMGISCGNDLIINEKMDIPEYIEPGRYIIRVTFPNSSIAGNQIYKIQNNSVYLPVELVSGATKESFPVSSINLNGATPLFTINGNSYITMHFMSDFKKEHILNFSEEGFNINFLEKFESKYDKDGNIDFSWIDEKCIKALSANKNAFFVLTVTFDNILNAGMKNWTDGHKDELVMTSDRRTKMKIYGDSLSEAPSMASDEWRKMSEDFIRKLVNHLQKSKYGERVIGILPCGGVTFEWQYWGSIEAENNFIDFSKPYQSAFRRYFKNKYVSIENLNKSWNTSLVSFDDVQIPSKEERCSILNTFIDPLKNRKLIDYAQFHSELVADVILQMSKAVKEESKNKLICGTYYGYINHVLGKYRYQSIGHFALNKLLNSPYIDFLISPSMYSDRDIGGGSGHMSAFASIRLHKKLWIDQADIRTLHALDQVSGAKNLADSKAVLQRHFAVNLIKGISTEWYDFSAGWISSDKRFMDLTGKFYQIEKDVSKVSRKTYSTDNSIAVITDEKSTYYTACASDIHAETVGRQYKELSLTGAGFDTYLLDDIEKMPKYKCYLFLNTFRISKEQREYINSKLKKDNRTLIFVYAPGYSDEQKISVDGISDITGLIIKAFDKTVALKVNVNNLKNKVSKYLKVNSSYGTDIACNPIFYPEDGVPVGVISGTDKNGLVIKENKDWTLVYSAAPVLPAALLRGIIENSGVRISNSFDGDVTYAGDKMIAVHTLGGGKRTINFPKGCMEVKELFTDKTYPLQDGLMKIELTPRSTFLFLEK